MWVQSIGTGAGVCILSIYINKIAPNIHLIEGMGTGTGVGTGARFSCGCGAGTGAKYRCKVQCRCKYINPTHKEDRT